MFLLSFFPKMRRAYLPFRKYCLDYTHTRSTFPILKTLSMCWPYRLTRQAISNNPDQSAYIGGEYRPDSEKRYCQNYQSKLPRTQRAVQIRFPDTLPPYLLTRDSTSPAAISFFFSIVLSSLLQGGFLRPPTKRRFNKDRRPE